MIVSTFLVVLSLLFNGYCGNVDQVLQSFRKAYDGQVKKFGKPYLASIGFEQNSYGFNDFPLKDEKFDFIVIGAGGAGCIVANRLSEDPKWRVLLIEAGGQPDILTKIPSLTPIWSNTDMNWKFKNVKQCNVGIGLEEETLAWTGGKGLGGSTSINEMIADRGSPEEYDEIWKSGNPGWAYKDVLPFFKILETASVRFRSRLRGKHGPVHLENDSEQSKASRLFIEAAINAGYVQGHRNNGVAGSLWRLEKLSKRGLRMPMEKAYLEEARNRKNLLVITNGMVTKVITKENPLRAIGVEVRDVLTNKTYIFQATKEIILCAGVFGSPRILLQSGIGPEKDLKKIGISPVKSLPVGRNLYDHLTFPGLIFKTNTSITKEIDELYNPEHLCELFQNGTGPLTSLSGLEVQLIYKTPLCKSRENIGDIGLSFYSSGLYKNEEVFKGLTRINSEMYEQYFVPHKGEPNVFSIIPSLLLPESRGFLKLQSKDPNDPLYIDGNFMDNDNDLSRLVYGIKEAQNLVESHPFKQHGAKLIKTELGECSNHPFDCYEFWECIVGHLTVVGNNPVGTCRMGPDGDPNSVVDHKLRVKGIRKLRVIDRSIIPQALTASGSLPTLMVAEKGAYMVFKAWHGVNDSASDPNDLQVGSHDHFYNNYPLGF